MATNSKPDLQALTSKLLALQESVDCVICRGRLKRPVATICGHTFCGACVDKTFVAASGSGGGRGRAACPLCMTPLHKRSIRETERARSIIEAVQRIADVAKFTIKVRNGIIDEAYRICQRPLTIDDACQIKSKKTSQARQNACIIVP